MKQLIALCIVCCVGLAMAAVLVIAVVGLSSAPVGDTPDYVGDATPPPSLGGLADSVATNLRARRQTAANKIDEVCDRGEAGEITLDEALDILAEEVRDRWGPLPAAFDATMKQQTEGAGDPWKVLREIAAGIRCEGK